MRMNMKVRTFPSKMQQGRLIVEVSCPACPSWRQRRVGATRLSKEQAISDANDDARFHAKANHGDIRELLSDPLRDFNGNRTLG